MRSLALTLLLASCAGSAAPIPRDAACDEQADTWCGRIGEATVTGCHTIYKHWCGSGGEVATDAQDACLDAIRDEAPNPLTGWYIPDACGATFATWAQ